MRRRYMARDPYWTRARFNSTCSCGHPIQKEDRIFYYPSQKKAVCEGPQCGQRGAEDLADAKAVETVSYSNPYDQYA